MTLPSPKELANMTLPSKLSKFLKALEIQRPADVDSWEWQQLALLYKVMKDLGEGPEFERLAERLFAHLSHYQRVIRNGAVPFVSLALTRKQRRGAKRRGTFKPAVTFSDSPQEIARKRNSTPAIGLGMDSILPPPKKIRRDQVTYDAQTAPREEIDRHHALYVAGWSLAKEEH
ncbi:hypothetical protein [Pseudomonas sp. C9]|uniref:hypothetical protein n=1 Tax=Pseudomonas sp. C9 TaxID=1311337 RepID=UPI000986C724|nr:hypothetical protein [Pseudomonas sp. C9]OOG11313.1 hypothetical protein BMS17_04135 [Pseudomonas sp. C9]